MKVHVTPFCCSHMRQSELIVIEMNWRGEPAWVIPGIEFPPLCCPFCLLPLPEIEPREGGPLTDDPATAWQPERGDDLALEIVEDLS